MKITPWRIFLNKLVCLSFIVLDDAPCKLAALVLLSYLSDNDEDIEDSSSEVEESDDTPESPTLLNWVKDIFTRTVAANSDPDRRTQYFEDVSVPSTPVGA